MSFDLDHALDVAGQARPFRFDPKVWVTAFLHDVLEDTTVCAADLEEAGLSAEIVDALEVLTRGNAEVYDDYIRRVRDNPLASEVKMADLRINIKRTDDAHASLLPRYCAALRKLA